MFTVKFGRFLRAKKGEGNKGLAFTLKCLIMISLCALGEEVKAIFEKQRMRA